MGLVALLAARIKLPPWLIEALLAGLLILGIWLSGVFHEKARIERQVVKEQVEVEKRVLVTDHSHDQELSELRSYRDAHPVQPVRLCRANVLPPRSPEGHPGPTTADVLPVPGSDPLVRPAGDPPDIADLLGLLALRADQMSAGLRRRQELEP